MSILTPHQEKALDYKNHISLTANAGSGKTFVLSKRFIKIITEENISLRNIAAITFTDKAASELYKKIAILIEESIANSTDKFEIKKLENLRRQLVSANISTIHSFCIEILREHPVEAGLDANFSAIDEKMSDELIELSVEEMIKHAINSHAEENNLKYLIRYFASKNLFSREIRSLIKNRKNVLNVDEKIYSKPIEKIAGIFYSSFIEFVERMLLPDSQDFIYALSLINEEVKSHKPDNSKCIELQSLLNNYSNESSTEDKIKFILGTGNLILTTKGTINSKDYLNKKLKEGLTKEIDIVEEFFDDFLLSNLPDNHTEIEIELASFGKLMIHFFHNALAIYSKKKKENGYLDYEDILLYTKNILTNESVQKDLSDKYKYIMIDEYQDTNEIQYNIFLPILDYLKKGNLFVVGDEKQSIYMFRDAELEVFNLTKKDIVTSAGSEYLISLPDSFRMSPAICLFTNELFKNLFRKPNLFYNEVEHRDLVCARQDDVAGNIEILLCRQDSIDDNEDNTGLSAEADLVAGRIVKLAKDESPNDKVKWGDIAVLCRKRKYFPELEKSFTNYNIPFSIIGGKGFYQKQSVYDIYNYFSFLTDEKNDTALVGILRSPFFSRSDSEIYEISLQTGYSFWSKLINYSEDKPDFKRIVDLLRDNLIRAKNYNVPSLLRKILNESNLLAVLASRRNGIQEIANIEKIINVTIDFFSQGFKTLYDYVAFLKDSIESFEDEAQAAVADESNSVKIMTLHQAKGLEFSAVFLYKCDDTLKKDSIKAKKISVDKNFGLLTKVPLRENYSSEYQEAPVISVSNMVLYKKSLAEFKRLFYVGITRAKNYLFISGSAAKDNQFNENSFLGMLQEGLGIDFGSEGFNLKSNLLFLKNEGNHFINITKEMAIEIKIVSKIEINSGGESEQEKAMPEKFFRTEQISDEQKGEIISATKLSVFNQCPTKYFLTYDLGYQPLFEKYKKWNTDLFNKKNYEDISLEDERLQSDEAELSGRNIKSFSDVRGRVIHKLLQNEVDQTEISNFVNTTLENELGAFEKDHIEIGQLTEEIILDVNNFYNSPTYNLLKGYKKYYNEYEVYSNEKDYFLYGIIDKLILDGNTAIIVDYKTDDVSQDQLNEKAGSYFIQLKFYSYIVAKLFPDILQFRVMLIFIKHSGNPIIENIDGKEINLLSDKINNMVNIVRGKKYWKNIDHCKSCFYSTKWNKCIKE